MSSGKAETKIFRRMAALARPYSLHIAGICALSLLSAPLALLTPLPLKIIIDSVLGSHPLPGPLQAVIPQSVQHSATWLLVFAAALLVAVTVLTHLQGLASGLLQTWAGEGMVLDFRARIFAHVQRLSFAYHDAQGSADSAFRIQYDAPSIQFLLLSGLITLLSSGTTLLGMFYVTARLDLTLALVALGVSPVLLVLTRIFSPRLRLRWRDVKKLESSTNALVQEALASMRVVKAFGLESQAQSRFLNRATRRMNQLIRVSTMQGAFDLLVGITIAMGTAVTLYIGVMHVRTGRLTLGELMLVIAYLGQLYDPLKAVSKKLGDLQSGLASVERAFALLDEQPDVTERPDALPLARSAGHVRFEDVTFSYQPGFPVLTNVSLEARSGTRVGIQGRTGAGKSTLMSLLVRFYDVSSGRILIDGVDVRNYKLRDLRNQFGIVLQDPVLFSATIAENIAYGRPGASEAEIVEAARLANADEFISKLPDGYETMVGERGMRLSGGERQRISLARAFLKNAPILILDEPTSSVDLHTEAAILDALERLMQGRTTFMIAHRLTTLDHCDLRLEVRGGRVERLDEAVTRA